MLDIRALESTSGTVWINGNCTNNTFRNVNFTPRDTTPTCCPAYGLLNMVVDTNINLPNSFNLFTGCYFDSWAIDIPSLFYMAGDSNGIADSNIITNCRFNNYNDYGLHIDRYHSNTLVAGNSFYHAFVNRPAGVGLLVMDTTGGNITIQGNYFGGSQPHCGGAPEKILQAAEYYGMHATLGPGQTCSVQDNAFSNIAVNIPQKYTAMKVTAGNSLIGTVKGNLVGDTTGHTIYTTKNFTGIDCRYISGPCNIEVCNNTVSGIVAHLDLKGIHVTSIKDDTLDAGTGVINMHHNRLGVPGFERSLIGAGSLGFQLNGIEVGSPSFAGKICIDSNHIVNLWGCDTAFSYVGGSAVCGIISMGYRTSQISIHTIFNDTTFIRHNIITNLTSAYGALMNYTDLHSGMAGIWARSRRSSINYIYGNIIEKLYSERVGQRHYLYGISQEGKGIVRSNSIKALVNKSTVAAFSHTRGIHSTGAISCVNNLISLGLDSNGVRIPLVTETRGISLLYDTTGASEFYNNSVFISGASDLTVYGTSSYCAYIDPGGINYHLPVKNNIFYNDRQITPMPLTKRNHVYWYTNQVEPGNNIYYIDTTYGTLINPASGYTAFDTTTLITDPLFVNAATTTNATDMHLQPTSPAIDWGLSTPVVPDDIERDVRPQTGYIDAGCYEDTFIVPPTTNPPVILTTNHVICAGDSVRLSVMPQIGASYQWKVNGNNTGTDTSILVVHTAGIYMLELTNIYGTFQSSNSISVQVNLLPPVPVITYSGPSAFCAGGSVQLTAPAAQQYEWSNAAATNSITVSTAGAYSVTVTDSNGCTATSAPAGITVFPLPDSTLSITGMLNLCGNDSVVLTATPGYTYQWNTGLNTQSITVKQSGTYQVVITDANGCTAGNTKTVTANQSSYGVTGYTKCKNETFNFYGQELTQPGKYYAHTTNVAGCDSTIELHLYDTVYTYTWLRDTVCTGDTIFFGGIALTQAGTYIDTVTSATSCDAVLTLNLVVLNKVLVVLNNLPAFMCLYDLAIPLTGGNPPGGTYTIDGFNYAVFDPFIAGPGLHTVVYTYSDLNGCLSSDTAFINVSFCNNILQPANSTQVIIVPNPSTGVFTVELAEAPQKIVVLNNLGEVVETITAAGKQTTINLHAHAAGVYTAVVYSGHTSAAYRLVKE